MSGNINKAILVGNVGQDPDFSALSNGTELAKFSVATSRKWQKDGEWKSATEWHKIVVFDQYAVERCRQYVRKGASVYVEGEIRTRSYDKDGERRFITEIVLAQYRGKLLVLGGNDRDGAHDANEASRRGSGSASVSTGQPDYIDDPDDDIPF